MKEKRKSVLLSTLSSVGIATTIFCITGVVFDLIYNGSFQMENYAFTKMVIGAIIIGLGFGLPTFVYNNDNMPIASQTLIHMGIGCVIMTITAFLVGWIPTEKGVGVAIGTIAGEIAVSFIIWLFFYAHNKKMAKEMNQRIAKMNQ